MIVVDPVANYMKDGRPMRAAHLLSDLSGITGTKELMGFAMKIGLKASWLQNGATDTEHFDLMGRMIDAAVQAGALRVDRHRLVEILRKKRGERPRPVRVRVREACSQ